jgi:hypothetical protein
LLCLGVGQARESAGREHFFREPLLAGGKYLVLLGNGRVSQGGGLVFRQADFLALQKGVGYSLNLAEVLRIEKAVRGI